MIGVNSHVGGNTNTDGTSNGSFTLQRLQRIDDNGGSPTGGRSSWLAVYALQTTSALTAQQVVITAADALQQQFIGQVFRINSSSSAAPEVRQSTATADPDHEVTPANFTGTRYGSSAEVMVAAASIVDRGTTNGTDVAEATWSSGYATELADNFLDDDNADDNTRVDLALASYFHQGVPSRTATLNISDGVPGTGGQATGSLDDVDSAAVLLEISTPGCAA